MKKMINIIIEVTKIMHPNPVFLCGGAVRDFVMGNVPHDYDFCTPVEPDEIERIVKESGRRAYLTGKRFGTIGFKVEVDGVFHMIELTTFRTESYEKGSRKPNVEYVTDIHQDLSRRDFSINSMAISGKKVMKLIKIMERKNDKSM